MADEPKKKNQKRLSDFFGGQSTSKPTSINTSDVSRSIEKNENSTNPDSKSNKDDSKKNVPKREFNPAWLEKNPWLKFDNKKMTCEICISEGKDNPFTSGCTNFRHSTIVRHINSNQHRAAMECKSLRFGMQKQTLDLISKKNETVTAAMRCVYWLGKEQIPTLKYKSLLDLFRVQGCTFPELIVSKF